MRRVQIWNLCEDIWNLRLQHKVGWSLLEKSLLVSPLVFFFPLFLLLSLMAKDIWGANCSDFTLINTPELDTASTLPAQTQLSLRNGLRNLMASDNRTIICLVDCSSEVCSHPKPFSIHIC